MAWWLVNAAARFSYVSEIDNTGHPQPVYCTPLPCILHTFSLYTAHPQPVYCTPSACILHTLSLYTAHPQSVHCIPSACILHTFSLYTAHPQPVYCPPSGCTAHIYLIQGGSVGLTSYIYMYGDDLDAFGKPVHKDCFQKCINISKFTGGFLAFPEISMVETMFSS